MKLNFSNSILRLTSLCALQICFSSAFLYADLATLSFDSDDGFAHGTVVTTQYSSVGVTISAESDNGTIDTAIVYDSELGGADGNTIDGQDPDLERLVDAGISDDDDPNGWDGGNLPSSHNAGGVLIIQADPEEASAPTYGTGGSQVTSDSLFDPNDDAGGGVFTFEIDETNFTYTGFEIILADFEEQGTDYEVFFQGVDGGTRTVSYDEIIVGDLASFPSGNNYINELPLLELGGGEALDFFTIEFVNSSGSIDAIFLVPEPSSWLLLGLSVAAAGICLLPRRFRSKS